VLPDRYADVERIGHGGMGDIFRARDTVLGRPVAVKVLADRYASDQSLRARFTREALAAARLSAVPSVVTIFDVGEADGRPYIVMEHLPGGSLADRLADGAQPHERVLAWLEDAARALDAAHARGVVHRDVKPANLLLDDDGRVKVADFGIASAAGLHSLTAAGTVLGTAGYLAPEQARGERATPASDRYALAVVAYELLTGRRPFERESPTAEAAAHANDPPPPITSVAPSLPRALDGVFERALAKDPGGRYGTADEFVAALRGALAAETAVTRISPPPPRRAGRRAWPLVAAFVALLAAGGAALAAALAADDEPAAAPSAGRTTVERTVTSRGETVTVTATTEATAPTRPPSTEQTAPSGDPATLNDQGYELMQQRDFEGALPLLEQAVAGAQGSGSLTEAYADYNLAYTRFQLGRCDGVLDLLARSEQVQGERKEIDRLRRQAEKRCA
jgi:serine/threonine-protein kinase